MFYLPPLVLAIGILLTKVSRQKYLILALYSLIAAIALANFVFYIYPYSRLRNETPLALALRLNPIWTDHTVIYYAEMNTDNQLVKYFNPSTRWKRLDTGNLREIEDYLEIADKNGEDVWIETTAIKALTQAQQNEWLQKFACDCVSYTLDNKAYYMRFERMLPDTSTN